MWYNVFEQKTNPTKGRCLMKNIIQESEVIYKSFKEIKLTEIFTQKVIKHLLAIVIAVFTIGYKGKTVNFAKYSPCHRTTVAHFLNVGKWNDNK
jgi:hypothetical protein